VFATSLTDLYAGSAFAGVMDTTTNFLKSTKAGNQTESAYWLKLVQQTLSDVQYSIESAILILSLDGFHCDTFIANHAEL